MSESNKLEVSVEKAGIDFGLTLVKAFWIKAGGEAVYASTADMSREDLAAALAADGITDLCVGGNGPSHGFEQFRIHRPPGDDALGDEKRLQSDGAIHLLRDGNIVFPPRHLVVSIGTGTSYTLRDGLDIIPLIGSGIGAGTVAGLMRTWGFGPRGAIDAVIGNDFRTFDLMMADVNESFKGTPFVASSFALAGREWQGTHGCYSRAVAGAVSQLISDVVGRLLLHQANPVCGMVQDVIFLGTLLATSRVVREQLERAIRPAGLEPIFPPHGEYALAVGAYHGITT